VLGVGKDVRQSRPALPESRRGDRHEKGFDGLAAVLQVPPALLDQVAPREMLESHDVILVHRHRRESNARGSHEPLRVSK